MLRLSSAASAFKCVPLSIACCINLASPGRVDQALLWSSAPPARDVELLSSTSWSRVDIPCWLSPSSEMSPNIYNGCFNGSKTSPPLFLLYFPRFALIWLIISNMATHFSSNVSACLSFLRLGFSPFVAFPEVFLIRFCSTSFQNAVPHL